MVLTDDVEEGLGPFNRGKFAPLVRWAKKNGIVILAEEVKGGNKDYRTIWIWDKNPSVKTYQAVLNFMEKIFNLRPDYMNARPVPDEFHIYKLGKNGILYRLWWD